MNTSITTNTLNELWKEYVQVCELCKESINTRLHLNGKIKNAIKVMIISSDKMAENIEAHKWMSERIDGINKELEVLDKIEQNLRIQEHELISMINKTRVNIIK
jgi:hypothetical protein